MLKELNQLVLKARHQAAAWRRWYRKLPHNRVRRRRIRDGSGPPVGYGPPEPFPEPQLPPYFCSKVELPSGRLEVTLSAGGIEEAYCSARRPKPTAEEVTTLPITGEEVRRLFEQCCCR
jgi:hypothetical protein